MDEKEYKAFTLIKHSKFLRVEANRAQKLPFNHILKKQQIPFLQQRIIMILMIPKTTRQRL